MARVACGLKLNRLLVLSVSLPKLIVNTCLTLHLAPYSIHLTKPCCYYCLSYGLVPKYKPRLWLGSSSQRILLYIRACITTTRSSKEEQIRWYYSRGATDTKTSRETERPRACRHAQPERALLLQLSFLDQPLVLVPRELRGHSLQATAVHVHQLRLRGGQTREGTAGG